MAVQGSRSAGTARRYLQLVPARGTPRTSSRGFSVARTGPAPYTRAMKLWRMGLGSFLAAVVFACGGRAEGDSDEPRASEGGGKGPTTPAPTAPPPAYRGTTAPPPVASNAPPDRAPLPGPATELQLVEAMLGRYCGDCHG